MGEPLWVLSTGFLCKKQPSSNIHRGTLDSTRTPKQMLGGPSHFCNRDGCGVVFGVTDLGVNPKLLVTSLENSGSLFNISGPQWPWKIGHGIIACRETPTWLMTRRAEFRYLRCLSPVLTKPMIITPSASLAGYS